MEMRMRSLLSLLESEEAAGLRLCEEETRDTRRLAGCVGEQNSTAVLFIVNEVRVCTARYVFCDSFVIFCCSLGMVMAR